MVRKYSFLFIVLAALLWSLDGFLRRNLYTLPPTIVVLYEHVLGLILLFPFIFKDLKKLRTLSRKDLFAFLWISLLSGVLGTVMYTAALGQIQFIQYSVVVLLQQVQPLIVVLFAHLVLREKITKKYLVWAIPAVASTYLLSFPTLSVNLINQKGEIIAALLALGAAFAWGSSTAFSRSVLQKYSSQLVTGVRFGLTIPLALGFVLLTQNTPQLMTLNNTQWMALLGIALTTGMVAMLIYYRGLTFTEAKISAIAELTWPLSAVFVGYYAFGERLTITQIIGAMLLMISMYKIGMLQRVRS